MSSERFSKESVKGFTLIELLVVLMLVGLLVGLAVPHLFPGQQEQLRQEALRFSRVLQWVSEQSIYSGHDYRLQLDYAQQRYQLEVEGEDEGFSVINESLLKPHQMEGAVRFKADEGVMGWQDDTQQTVTFTPFGATSPLSLFFYPQDEEAQQGFRVWINRSEGRVQLELM